MLLAVLNCLLNSLTQILRKNIDKRLCWGTQKGHFLAMDEITDGGVIQGSNPQQMVCREALRGEDVPLMEQTILGAAVSK